MQILKKLWRKMENANVGDFEQYLQSWIWNYMQFRVNLKFLEINIIAIEKIGAKSTYVYFTSGLII